MPQELLRREQHVCGRRWAGAGCNAWSLAIKFHPDNSLFQRHKQVVTLALEQVALAALEEVMVYARARLTSARAVSAA